VPKKTEQLKKRKRTKKPRPSKKNDLLRRRVMIKASKPCQAPFWMYFKRVDISSSLQTA
jgi:hypothetical protein